MSKITTLRQAVASISYFPTRMNRSSQLGQRTSLPFAFTLVLTFLLSLVRVGDVWGQSFAIVGNGTAVSGSSYANPYNNGFWGNKTQQFVTSAQLTAAGLSANSSITQVGFNVTTGGTGNGSNLTGFTIKVFTTTATNPISAGFITSTLVAQSTPVTLNVTTLGWKMSTLASSFVWDGTSNLVIETCFNNSAWTGGCAVQWTTSGLGTGTWSRWYRADASNVCSSTNSTSTSTTSRPNIRFGYTPPPPTCPTLNSPANSATNVTLSPTLSWTAGSNTSSYDVYLSTSQTNVNNQAVVALVSTNQTGTSYTAAGLFASTVYYWRIVPKNAAGVAATGCSTFSFTTQAPSPTLTVSGTPSFSNQCINTTSTESQFSVSGIYLTNPVSIGAVNGYSYSTTSNGTYTSTLTLTPISGSLNQTVFVRFTPTSATTFNGPIVVSSTGAPSQNVAVTGTGYTQPSLISASANPSVVCMGNSSNLVATSTPAGSTNIKWYDAPTGGNVLSSGTPSGSNFSVTPSATTTYYAEANYGLSSVTIDYTGSIVNWTVPAGVTSINIDARGASGGFKSGATGGKGARMTGTFAVTPGQVLSILVGQSPGLTTLYPGGGGGTYVADGANYTTAVPLIVAGGGGGANSGAGTDAPTSTSGTGASPGTNGNGAPQSSCTGGGGGFFTSGANDALYGFFGGSGFRQGGAGGGANGYTGYQTGGFGGGAAANYVGSCNTTAGPGGGYSGGSSNGTGSMSSGNAGGSFNNGTSQVNTAGFNTGNGQVIITWGVSNVASCVSPRTGVTVTVGPPAPAQPSAIVGTLDPDLGSTQTYSVTAVAGVTYTWSFPTTWTILSGQGTNAVTVTVGTQNGTISVMPSLSCGNGTARTAATTIPQFRWKFVSANLGNNYWCPGETRNVSITMINNGVSAWTDVSGTSDYNVGIKWNSNSPNWLDYFIRVDAQNLQPGQTGTYTFSISAKNSSLANVYTTNLAVGTNNLTFDVVREYCQWFASNGTSCGTASGNTAYVSPNQSITYPSITTTGVASSVCSSTSVQTVTIPYTAVSSAPIAYSIVWTGMANQSITPFSFSSSGGTITAIQVPANTAVGTYNGVMTIQNAVGCLATQNVSLTIIPSPTLGGVSQTTPYCYNSVNNSNASINLTGLVPSLPQIATYSIGGGASQTISFTSTSTGTASLSVPVTMSNHGQTLSISSINCSNFSSNNSVVLNIIAAPLQPSVSPTTTTINVGGSATFIGALSTSNPTSNTLTWYDSPTSTSAITLNNLPVDQTTFNSSLAGVKFCDTATTYTYYLQENDLTTGCPSARLPFTIVTKSLFTKSPNNLLICQAGGSVTITANIAADPTTPISWYASTAGSTGNTLTAPTTNVTPSNPAILTVSPQQTTHYQLSGPSPSPFVLKPLGCTNSFNPVVFPVGVLSPLAFTPTATPDVVCAGENSVLAANLASSSFSVSSITNAPSSTSGTVNILCNACGLDDGGWTNVAIPFTYNFFGNNYSSVNVGSNGVLQFGVSTGLNQFTYNSGPFPSTAYPSNIIAAAAVDLMVTSGQVRTWTSGIAPTRVFIVEYLNVAGYIGGSNNVQIKLFETTGIVEIHVTSATAYGSSSNKVVGLQDLTQTIGATAYSSSANISNTAWRFVPGATYTYQWSTAGSPISNATSGSYTTPALANAGTATYTVAATNPVTQCATSQNVNITVNGIPNPPQAQNSVQCGPGVPTASVSSGNGSPTNSYYNWYSSSTTNSSNLVSGINHTGALTTYYSNDFSANTGVGILSGDATLTGNNVRLTSNAGSLLGGLTIPGSGYSSSVYQMNFDIWTVQNGGADGISYSFADDADAASTTVQAEHGTGSKLVISFDEYGTPGTDGSPGTRIIYGGAVSDPAEAVGGVVLAYSNNTAWNNSTSTTNGTAVPVQVDINAQGQLTLTMNNTVVFSNIQLPASFISANKSNWKHVFKARTGLIFAAHRLDNVIIKQSGLSSTPTQSVSSSTTYYVTQVVNNCPSATATPVTVTVNPVPAAPSVNPSSFTYCQGISATTLTATPTGSNTMSWYTGAVSGAGSSTAPTPSTAAAGTTTYNVTQTDATNACVSPATAITVTVNATPSAPAYSSTYSTGTITQCQGTSNISIAAAVVASAGGTLNYYTVPTGGSPLGSVPATDGSVASTVVYYVSQIILGCEGPRVAVTSVVNPSLTPAVAISASTTTVCPGGAITFAATPTNGGPAPSYQWFLNGSAVAGQTSASYALASPAAGNTVYVTMVSNEPSCLFTPNATSSTITLNSASVAPSVTIIQSTGTTICQNTSVTFSVQSSLNMGAAPTYSWLLNGVQVGTGVTYTTTSLANGNVVTLAMTSNLPSSCLNSSATATSNAITMTVTPATAITAQPANASVCLGGSQALSVTAIGTGTITYQWQSSTTPTGTYSNISFASNSSSQSATLSVPSVSGQLSYQLVATSSCGSATSNVATISINQATVINTQPQPQTVCQGSPVTFSVGAIGTGTLTYQWRYNGSPITGATSASYTIPTLALGDAGAYSVVVTATCGSVTSANAQLTVTPLTTISVQPVGSTVCAGSPVNLSVTAAGTGTLTYQWMQNGTAVAGETSALYTIPTSLVSQSGSYTVVVTGGCSSLTSSAATVVINTVTAINTQPLSYTGCAFTPTSISVGAVGTNLTYAWSVGTNGITGATNATYSLANPQTSNSGNYTVLVSGVCGTVTSNIALVTINPLPSPGIINGGVSGICVGSTETLTNNVSGGVWTSNNTSIATVNASTGAVTGVSAGNVTITYTVTNTFGCTNTTTKIVQIKSLPTAVILPPPATQFCIGESMTLQASNAFAYLWSNGATTQSTTVSTSGNYTITVTGNNGCTATSTPLAISVIPAPSVGQIVGSPNLCVGSSYSFTSSTANGLWTSSNPSVVNVNPNSGLVTASAAGTAILTYNVANVPGCLNTNPGSTTASVTVNTPPVAQITQGGATTFCQGGAVTLTANAGVSYLWSNGATTQAISATTSGSYTVTVTNASGCSTTSLAVPVTVNPAPNANIFPGTSVNVCAGSSVTLSTGTAAAYAWSNGATTPTISVNAAGSFSVTLTGSNGCTATSAATIVTLTSLPTANITTSGATSICQGSSVSLSATSGTGYTYLWSNGATAQTINATASGAYSVTISNNGCSATSAATSVNVIPTPTASITANGPLTFCDGGSVTLSAPSGNGFTYAWSNGSIAQNISSAVSGTFSVTVSNSFGCSATSSAVAVTVNPLPAISQLSGPSTVCMGSSGSLTHAFTGGIYSVANTSVAAIGQTSGAITPVAPGSTLVTYTYANAFGCSNSVQTNLTVNPSPSATATPNGATTFCQGGSVGLEAPAALQTTYLWSNGSTQQNINATTSGNYSVVMTNSFGCSSTSNTVAVTVNALPSTQVYPSAAVTICSGNSVTLSTSTAAAYQWSNGSSAANITVNAAGSYTATLTGSNGCTATTAPIVVTVNQTPTAAITASGPTAICQGSNVTLTASAGAGYTYLWSNGATTASIVASSAGANTVTVTNNGCSATSSPATITINPVPSAAITASGPLSFCDGGSVSLTAPAGNNFTYLWTNGSTSQSVATTTSGSFGLTVTNAFGCSTVGSPAVVTVNPLPAQTPLIGSTTVCQGTGPILSHAVPGGIYATSNSSVLNVATLSGNLTPGNIGTAQITYTYSNAFGCSSAVTQTFSVNPSPTASISPLGATTFCQGGSVDIQASTGASSYLWSNGATTSTISAATSGTYTVVVSNSFGCTATSNAIAVNVNPAPNATIYPGAAVNICDGSSVTLSTGTAAAYLWSNGSTAPTITVNAAGTYSVVLTGSNGCTASSSPSTVTVTPVPVASISASGPTAICQGSSVTLTAAPATNYLWNNGATTQSITVSTVGSYFVNVGTGSCSATSTPVFVSYNPVPVADITPSGPTTFCLGSQVTLNGPSGNGYTYLWSNGATTQGITSAAAGNFSVTVTNAFGCSASSSSQAVVVNPLPVVTPITGTATLCSNGQTQLANVMTGGIYTSSNLNVASIGNASGLVSGIGAGSSTISYLYTDNNGCSNTVTYPITVVAAPVATIAANGATSFCQGGSVDLQASSGTTYLWSTGATTPTINVSTAGNYSVTVTAANGCSASSTSTPVVVNALPTAAIQQGATVAFCAGASAQLTAVPAASYLWSNGSTAQTINVLAPGSYTVSVTGTNGCTATSSATVVTQTALPAATISASGSTAICQGASVTLTASTAASYLWSNGATSQSITVLNPGSYTVQTSNGSCIANSAPTTVSLNPVPTANITANGSTTFCSGGQVTLAATTGNNFTYLWSNGSTGATLVTAAAGNYSVTVTNSFGCSATSAAQAVVVNALPTVPAISGSATVCSNAQTLLTNTLSGGVYSISNPSVATIGQNSGLVSGLNAGAALVSYTVTNTNGCTATTTLPFTVLAAPAASVSANGSTSFCQGASLTLTSSAGASYAWNTGATTPSITTTAGGSYAVTVTAANGCSAQSQNMILTVNPLPTVATTTGSATVCSNGTTLLGNTTGGGVWSSSNTSLATVNPTSGLVTGVAAGALNINYTVTNSSGCSAVSSKPMSVITPTAATIGTSGTTTICQGSNVTLTASSSSSYLWSTGATTQSITVAQSGPYSVTTVNNGCTAVSATTTVTVVNPPVASISANGLTALCSGGSVTLTAAPATTYLWSTGATTQAITVSAAGNYSVTATSNGCSATSAPTAVTLQATPSAAVTAGGATSFCQGGSVTLTAASAGSYLWSNGANTQSITVAAGGSYSVNVTTNGCSATSTPTVVSILPSPTAVITNTGSTTFCAGGSVVLNAPTAPTGSTFTYVWRLNGNPITGATAQTYTASAAGVYSLVVSNNQGCTATSGNTTVVVNALPTATITPSGTTSICAGASVTLTAPASAAYVWSNGATTQSITASTAGAYTVTVNSNGCTATSSATTVTVNALPVATITASGATNLCQGSSVTLTASPATTYLWSTGATTPSITVNTAGNYSVSNTTNGCSATSVPTTINVQALPSASIAVIGATTFCQGASVTLTASSAGSYLWSNGATTQTIVATTPGNYTVQVSSNGCSATSSAVPVVVNALPTAGINAAGQTTFCQGGTVTLTATPASSYLWSNGATTSSITVNTSGSYGVMLTNALGCTAQATPVGVNVQSLPTTPQIAVNGSLALCPGATVTLSAPTAASYLWTNGATTQTISVSAAANYGLTVGNAAGCTAAAAPVTVTSLSAPTAVITANGPTTFCQGGTVVLSATPASSYLWSNGATTQSIAVQNAGPYSVQVTANGCTATSTATTIVVTTLPTATITANGPTTFCQGGSVVLSAPTASNYLWSTGATSQQITVSTGGQYELTLTANGCSASASPVLVSVQALPSSNVTASGPLTFCEGGNVVLSADPATSYSWSNGQTTQSITVSQTANITLTTSNGVCSATSAPLTITMQAAPALAAIAGTANVCIGNNSALSNAAPGGVWSSTATGIASIDNNGVVTGVSQGNTTVQYAVTYANGCTVSTSVPFTVNSIAPVAISANGPLSFCSGGAVQLSLPAGLSYVWSNGSTFANVVANATATYSATVTNAAGCSYQVSPVQVTVFAAPSAGVQASAPALCSGQPVTLSAATAAASYSWSTGAQTNAISVNQPGNYVLTIQDANGCSASTIYNLATGITPSASITAAGATNFCSGSSVVLNANNYTGGSYLWSNGATGTSITASTSGLYAVTITSPSGCSATSNAIVINVLSAPSASIAVNGNTTSCSNQTLSLAVSATGNYLWTNGLTAQSITPATSGNYGVTVTGANGCQTTVAPVAITILPAPIAAITANGPTTFCEGGTVALTASGAATYVWSTNQTAAQITASTAGVYTVTATAANGCVDTESIAVSVNALPANYIVASGPLSFCEGETVTLSAQPGNTVLWSNGAPTPTITVGTSGTYSAQVTSPQGCSVATNALTVQVNQATSSILNETALDAYILNGILYTQSGTYVQNTTNAAGCDSTITLNLTLTVGLDDNKVLTYSVQPNPTDAIFTLVASEALYSDYIIQDAQGKVVGTGTLTGTTTTINIDQVARGIYFLKVAEAAEAIRIVKN